MKLKLPPPATALDQALALRGNLRSTLADVQQLIRTLREERQRQRTAKTASRRQRLTLVA